MVLFFFQSRVPVHIHPAEHHVLAHFRRHSRNYQGRNGYWRRWSLVDTKPCEQLTFLRCTYSESGSKKRLKIRIKVIQSFTESHVMDYITAA